MGKCRIEDALKLRRPTPEAVMVCGDELKEMCDPWEVVDIFEKFQEWLRRDIEHAQRLLGNARLQATVVLAIKRHESNLEVARLGCGVVAGCCQRSGLNAEIMLRAGVVEQIFRLMDEHQDDGITQDNACVALWRLAEKHANAASVIVELGGLEQIFRATAMHPANPFVQVNACFALERLYLKGEAAADGMEEFAENAMKAHPSNTQIKRGAGRLLDALRNRVAPCARSAPTVRAEHKSPTEVVFDNSADKALSLPLHDWLMALDSVGFLMAYHSDLVQNFDSLDQVIDV